MAKLAILEEEADESCYWLELIIEAELIKPALVQPLLKEANELVAIVVASKKTARKHVKPSASTNRQSKIPNRKSPHG